MASRSPSPTPGELPTTSPSRNRGRSRSPTRAASRAAEHPPRVPVRDRAWWEANYPYIPSLPAWEPDPNLPFYREVIASSAHAHSLPLYNFRGHAYRPGAERTAVDQDGDPLPLPLPSPPPPQPSSYRPFNATAVLPERSADLNLTCVSVSPPSTPGRLSQRPASLSHPTGL